MNIFKHYPHQIREVNTDQGKFRIAIPPITLVYNSESYTTRSFLKVEGNVYNKFSLIKINDVSNFNTDQDPFERFWEEQFLENFAHCPFFVNRGFAICSMLQWQQLTTQNPDFMREQFDPNREKILLATSYRIIESGSQNIPNFMVHSNPSPAIAKIYPPITRTILSIPGPEDFPEYYQLSFPGLALVKCNQMLWCLAHTRDNSYIPFNMQNISYFGFVCMGEGRFVENDLGESIDYFWNSTFREKMSGIPVNEKCRINSIRRWSQLTADSPDFFRDHFDPIHAEKSSPLIYTLGHDSLSWKFQ